jgi:hypothetical protein
MPKDDLRKSLEAVREEIHAGGPLSDQDRALLLQLHGDIEDALQPEGAAPSPQHGVVLHGATTAVERFQQSHPALTQTLSNLVDTLVAMGL